MNSEPDSSQQNSQPQAHLPDAQTSDPTPASPTVGQAAGQPTSPPPAGANQGGQAWMPQIADDTDLIEKEWVDKAKEVVAKTAHDPYLQNKELNKVKAEYLKKRYNKEIRPSD